MAIPALKPHPRLRFSRKPAKLSPIQYLASATAPALSLTQNVACGAVARAAQILAMYPVDTIKVRIQVSRTSANSPLSAVSAAIRQGTLYRGVAFSMLGQVPYGMLTFGAYESLRSHFKTSLHDCPEWLHIILAASMGDAMGSLWLTPSEVVKSKTQAGLFQSPFAAVKATAAQGPSSFYQGYSAAIARDIPFRAIQLSLYERLRTLYANSPIRLENKKPLSALENLLLGAVAGTITAATTTPLDVIRTRMMSQASGSSALYKNAIDCVVKTVSREGPTALFKGIVPRCLLIGPSSAVFFLAYETTKSFFRRQQRGKEIAYVSKTPLPSRRLPRLL